MLCLMVVLMMELVEGFRCIFLFSLWMWVSVVVRLKGVLVWVVCISFSVRLKVRWLIFFLLYFIIIW